jgi:hypothetical protein
MSFIYSGSQRKRETAIIQIPLDSISESSNFIPYALVSGACAINCTVEKRKLKIRLANVYSKAIISYGLLNVDETISTGSVISEMEREGEYFVHLLHDDAVMLATIYLN